MSIINQMLKDLEKRQPFQKNQSQILERLFSTNAVSASHARPWLFALIALLVISGVYLLLSLSGTEINSAVPPPLVSGPTPAFSPVNHFAAAEAPESPYEITKFRAAPPLMPATLPPPNAILQSMLVLGDPSRSELQINLNSAVLYHVSTQPQENTFSLILENAYLPTAFTLPNTMDTAIKSIETSNEKNNRVKIQVALFPNVQITHLGLDTQNASRLIVTLAASRNIVSQTNKGEKKGRLVKQEKDSNFAEELYENAMSLIQEHRLPEGIQKLQSLLAQAPDFNIARENLSMVLLQENRLSEAAHVLQNGLTRTPDYLPFTQLLARVYMMQGDTSQALKLLQSKAPSLQENPDYYVEMAAVYQQKQPLQAAKLYDELLQLNPTNATWWMGMGIALESAKKNNAALEAYQKASELKTLNPQWMSFVNSKIQTLGGMD